MITYHHDRQPETQEIAVLYACAPLRRPIGDLERLRKMYAGSNLVITAFDGQRLVGILRGWTDGVYDGYVCDLAIHAKYQKSGIGAKLLDEAASRNGGISWILLASPLAEKYYAHVGWAPISTGWQKVRPEPVLGYDDFIKKFEHLRIEGDLFA